MRGPGRLVSLLGATGAVGEEILRVLAERKFPVLELRAFASGDSEGCEVEFDGDVVAAEAVNPDRVFGSDARLADVVIAAAPGVLSELLADPRASRVALVDVSGTLELDASVPLHLCGEPIDTPAGGAGTRAIAVPRGPVAGLALSLHALASDRRLTRVSVVTLESASGAGRRGVGELSEQTVNLLNSMSGEPGAASVFPEPLAFNSFPLVGDPLATGETSEERRLRHVVRRVLEAPGLPVEVTRLRVPIFGGSLAVVHLGLERALRVEQARELWGAHAGIEVLDPEHLLSSRASVGLDRVLIGRVRASGESEPAALAFVLALDELRAGAALAAVEAAEALVGDR